MIAILKYNAGNTRSVKNALDRLGYESIITDDATELRNAAKVIFPGVGEASTAMHYLRERKLDKLLVSLTQPVLGICLGLQLMCTHTEESDTACLGIFDCEVKRFLPPAIVPHMGWNTFTRFQGKLFDHLQVEQDVYYVHSYYAVLCKDTIASCSYGIPFSAALRKSNFYATQFHPEKSSEIGAQIIKNFLAL